MPKLVRPLANAGERAKAIAEEQVRQPVPEMPLDPKHFEDPFYDVPIPTIVAKKEVRPGPGRPPNPPPVPDRITDDFVPDEPQPTNSKRVTEFRRFDKTQLKENGHGQGVHRDYAAHFFRWGWAKKLVDQGSFVLDVGCGQDQPLAKVLAAGVAQNLPAVMVAVDYNKIQKPFNVNWLTTLDQFDFTTRWQETLDLLPVSPHFESKFDYIVNFEVIEHMHTCDGRKLLTAMRQCVKSNGRLMLSTPVFNGRAAANHLHEYTVDELWALLEETGWVVEKRFGTFASYNDLKKVLNEQQRADLERLREFYDGDVAACFWAPLYPDASRNNAWLCAPAETE